MALPCRRLHRSAVSLLALAATVSLGGGAAGAQGIGGYGGGYGFADEAVRGAYVGAPFGAFPAPTRIVPAPWSYGTYGVPTVSGIAQAPAAAPSLTVINPGARVPSRRSAGARILSRDAGGDWERLEPDAQAARGARIIAVTVPRR
ncbi:hypothetical protein [uncultured Methylobacterium sp.]|uniref:hypothetical protein n=1 Tax=uncultured Methylobacterium sp. TaxID=157278 RepID=UPI0035CB1CD7